MNELLQREAYVIVHGQSLQFRIVKYVVLLGIATLLYKLYGLTGIIYLLTFAFTVGIIGHIFFRWKTNGWTKSWGPFKTPIKD